MPQWERDTWLVHAGTDFFGNLEPTALPIYPSTSYRSRSGEELDQLMGGTREGFSYARHGNPNVAALVEAMKVLEHAETGIATASGMAAIDAALYATGLAPHDRVLVSQDIYGASLSLLSSLWAEFGVETAVGEFTDADVFVSMLAEVRPKAVLIETISNPLLKVLDVPELVRLAHGHGAQVIVDNTFATPVMYRPAECGADLVVHSATKYLGGHGDAMGGVVLGRQQHEERLHQYLKLRGAVLGPFESWLIHRGLRTLGVRFEKQSANALQVAQKLQASGLFTHVYYPLFADHPTYATAQRLLPNMGGAVVTLELSGGKDRVFRFMDRLELIASATTVGDVYSLCLYPLIASHRNQTPEQRAQMGITDGTIRISIGLEDPGDIAGDLIQAATLSA
ncbi:PLP-dependent aspartate aminotransferase family protein [Sulfobacillus sp. hq2]|uniref:trans-sulfuration enzyme family protein n=1 Tax=Sulfobacillus TaxID=28033 RepID=UPI000CD16845|nr:PLP-dependent aspartate aminotransferase family protein [Sulfobacillus sp. hq2]POB10735.1 methionine gamma-lyase [Sulfobacillus sp. hq2]